MRDLNRKAVVAKQRAATQALKAGNIFAALDGSDDEDADEVARPAGAEFTESAGGDNAGDNSPWASLFVESAATLTFQPPKQSAAEAAAAAAAAEAEKADAQAAEAAELGAAAIVAEQKSMVPPSHAPTGSSAASAILDSVQGQHSVEAQQEPEIHDMDEVRDEEKSHNDDDGVAELEDHEQGNPLLTKIENRWPMIAVGGDEFSVGSSKADAATS